jgi:hypothetical protein
LNDNPKGSSMLDLIYIAVTIAFFAVAIAYTYACGRL